MYLDLLPSEIFTELYKYLYYPVADGGASYQYYSLIRFNCAIIVRLHHITNTTFTPILINDKEIFTSLPLKLNNYYSWAAIEIKKYLKQKNITSVYKCIFMYEGKDQASIVINCNSNKDIDAMVFIL